MARRQQVNRPLRCRCRFLEGPLKYSGLPQGCVRDWKRWVVGDCFPEGSFRFCPVLLISERQTKVVMGERMLWLDRDALLECCDGLCRFLQFTQRQPKVIVRADML